MPRKRRCSVMQKKKYHYKKVKSEESPTNEDGVCLETKDSPCLDSSQLDHSYGVSDPEEVSVVNSTHLDHSYECSDPEEFCRTSTSHHDISDGCQDLKELPHSDFLPPGELGDGDSELNIDSDSNGQESVVHNDIPLGQRVEVETVEITDPYLKLQSDLLGKVTFPFILDSNGPSSLIEIIQLSRSENRTSVKLSLVIGQDFKVSLFVHRVLIPENHEFWTELSSSVKNVDDVCKILDKLMPYGVCVGNPDQEFQELTPDGCGLFSAASSQELTACREGHFCAVQGNLSFSSTIRNVQCTMLVLGARCPHCSSTRRHLRARKTRLEKMALRTLPLSSTYKHSDMTKDMLIKKINQQTAKIKTLQQKLDKMRRDCDREIRKNPIQNEEIKDLMATCEKDIDTVYSYCSSSQNLFWKQQMKAIKSGKNGMRWDPTIIRWCLNIRQKSSAAYDALRDSGFIELPSSRTLFAYSHK